MPIVPVSLLEKSSTEDGAYYSHATAAATASATEHQHQRRDATIDQPPQSLEFNIVSLNMLAETYISPRSHPGLPASYANVVFDSTKRRKLLVDTLERFCSPQKHTRGSKDKWDVIALQELDLVEPDDPILPAFQRWGYEVVRTPNDKRKDCCAIVFDSSKFSLIEYDVVKFDDLASLQHSVSSKEDEDDVTKKSSNSPPELTGLVRSFLRRNYAIVAHLKSVDTKQSVIVASVHLYWNPGFEYVKLCQAKYLLDRVAKFATVKARSGEGIEQIPPTTDHKALLLPTVICGDMNSKPGSVVHSLFVKPYVDARTVAPWNYFWGQDEEIMYTEEEKNGTRDDEKDRQDGVVAAKSDPTNERDDDQKNGVNGFTMNGLPSHLTMYCGLTADDNDSSRNGGTQEPTQQNDHLEAHVQIDAEYEGLRSSLLAWNGLHKRAMETSSPMNVSLPTDDATNSDDDGLKASLAWSKLHQRITPQDYQHSIPPLNIKYMLDYTLNRFTR